MRIRVLVAKLRARPAAVLEAALPLLLLLLLLVDGIDSLFDDVSLFVCEGVGGRGETSIFTC